MIYRLRYYNKDGVEARVDIQKGLATPVIEVEGTERQFILSYNNDKGNKSGRFLSSSADIEIYETTDLDLDLNFNIDNLKTSNETELSVTHYINNVISWQGFIIPDFFSIEVRNNPVITMTASDRLGTLKNVTLADLPSMISLRELAVLCLNKTGLSLPLRTMADFNNGTGVNDFFNSKILTQRLSDTKGRSISCYDILSSILTASNSFLVQRSGGWHIINKIQHEAGSGKLYTGATSFINWSDVIFNFSDISTGGRRTIIPVASTVGVFHEFGGSKTYPSNYDFKDGANGWTVNFPDEMEARFDNRNILGFDILIAGGGYQPVYGTETNNPHMVVYGFRGPLNYVKSEDIVVPTGYGTDVEIKFDINASAPIWNFGSFQRMAVFAVKDTETKALVSGSFVPLNEVTESQYMNRINFEQGPVYVGELARVATESFGVSGKLSDAEGLDGYTIHIRLYSSDRAYATVINFATINFAPVGEMAKGNLYKTERTDNYTKDHDIDTSLFADYLTTGLNGYFYRYAIDDTSSLYNSNNELTSKWTAYNDTEQLPLLQHVTRQRSRLFSVAHDLLSAEIEVNNFDPLAIFVACEKRYTVVSAQFDFFKSNLSVELEEVAFQNASVRDFIYSYFGDGESGIKGIGGISGGGGGSTGGGLTPEQIELIGGIKERVDEVEERINNSRVGVANLLRNTGFLGDFQPLNVDNLTALENNSPIDTNPLKFWIHSNTSVIDAPSRSGKGVRIGSIQQNVKFKAGEPYVLSFWAKGTSLIVELVDTIEIPLTSEYKRYSFDIVASETKEYTFTLTDNGNTAEVYEIMLSNGNAKVSYSYAEEDDVKAISQIQAINTIINAIKTGKTEILGGLILSTMIQLGKYKDGVMEKVNAGINGIYNNNNDPAFWAGGSFEDAIRTVQKFIDNPNYEPTEAEWADMANIVFTHGGDGFFRGYVYALGGFFRGKVSVGSPSKGEIILDPETSRLRFMRSGRLAGELFFTESGWVRMHFFDYWENGNRQSIISFDTMNGLQMQKYDESGILLNDTVYRIDGQVFNDNRLDLTDAQADELLQPGQEYRTGRIIKVKI